MIFLLIIITAPVAALLCKNNNSLFPWSGLVEMPPNSFIDLECSGSPNITVSSQAGQLDKTLISKNTTRFSYKSPEIPCFALASGLEIVCASPSSAECRFFIDFDFPLQVLTNTSSMFVSQDIEVNISIPFLAPHTIHNTRI